MAEDNGRDIKKTSRKDAKREARIEAKRRKLAEQRASRNAAGEGSQHAENSYNDPAAQSGPAGGSGREWYDADRQVIKPIEGGSSNEGIIPPMGKGGPGAGSSAGKDTAAPDHAAGMQRQTSSTAAQRKVTADSANRQRRIILGSSAEQPRGTGQSRGDTNSSGSRASSGGARRSRRSSSGIFTRQKTVQGRSRGNGGFRLTPGFVLRCAAALIVLIFIIHGALALTDYYDKKTDVFIPDGDYNHAPRHDDCVPLKGIDVSVHQGNEIKWKKVKTSGADFVFIRAGYRAADDGSLHEDENFAENADAAADAGLMVGAYFYSQALDKQEAKEEAEFVLRMLKGHDITMPVMIDFEIYKGGRLDQKIQAGELYAASLYHDIVLGFTKTIQDEGYESGVYANYDMLTNYMQADILDDSANIWLARYDRDPKLDAEYWFWQCTDNSKAGGIQGKVDMDFWYMEPGKAYETKAKHKKKAVSIGECKIAFSEKTCKLKRLRAEPKYALNWEGKGLKEGRDYVSSVVHNTKAGTGYVVVRGIGKYKDWTIYPFTIEE